MKPPDRHCLASGNVAIALLANTIATGAALIAPVSTFGSSSRAYFNPLVTFIEFALGRRDAGKAG